MGQEFINQLATTTSLNREGSAPSLTKRQQQILALIKAGKVNKEIANELGIGLGTVKQHVVALFKRLHVSNRTMAVFHGPSSAPANRPESPPLIEGILERRPCVVLSVFLPESAPQACPEPLRQGSEPCPERSREGQACRREAVQEFNKTFAAIALDHGALFLACKDHAGDLIFGIQRGTEQDIFKALRAARSVFDALAGYPNISGALRGGLTAGLAIASMNRYGGWSGEAVASAVIAEARELADNAAPGELALGLPAKNLLEILGPAPIPSSRCALPGLSFNQHAHLSFSALDRMPWGKGNPLSPKGRGVDSGNDPPLIGREVELERLESLLAEVRRGISHLVYIEGETGMGKSRLCRYVAERGVRLNGRLHHFICHSGSENGGLYMFPSGAPVKLQAMLHCIKSVSGRSHDVVIVDDGHLLPANVLTKLTDTAHAAKGKLVLITARRFPKHAAKPTETIRLGHLPQSAIEKLVAQTLSQEGQGESEAMGGGESAVALRQAQDRHHAVTIAHYAAGVPLFAIELARHNDAPVPHDYAQGRALSLVEGLPLALRVVIGARMDSFNLDRTLLRQVSRAPTPCTVAEIARALRETPDIVRIAAEQAVASGVLWQDDNDRLSFAHPLLRRFVNQSGVE